MASNGDGIRRRGRPPAAAEKRKRHTLSFRLSDELKDALQKRADANGRSLSEEVEATVQIELFIDMKLLDKLDKNENPEFAEKLNTEVDTINECLNFQNIVARLRRDVFNLGMKAKNINIHSFLHVYAELDDEFRFRVEEIKNNALDSCNKIVMQMLIDKLKDHSDNTLEKISTIEQELEINRNELNGYIKRLLESYNIKSKSAE